MGKSGSLIILYPHRYPDHSQNLMEVKLYQDPSSYFCHKDPTSSLCVILLMNKQTNNSHECNTSLAEVKNPYLKKECNEKAVIHIWEQ